MSSKMLGSKKSDSQETHSKKTDDMLGFMTSGERLVTRQNRPSASLATNEAVLHELVDDSEPHLFDEASQSALHKIVDRLNGYYTPEEVRTWLNEPHPQLGGEKAIDLIENDRTPEVLAVIDRLDNAVFI